MNALVNYRESCLSFCRTALSHTQSPRHCLVSAFWSRLHRSSYQKIIHTYTHTCIYVYYVAVKTQHNHRYGEQQPRGRVSGLHYLWRRPIACLPVRCVQNVNELTQHLLDIQYNLEQSLIESAINEWCMSLRACLRVNF